ncbi:MAG: tetratricopeptide repeat protein [Phormidesmis sp.]
MDSETTAQDVKQVFERALKLIKVERVFEAMPLLTQVIEAEPDWAETYVVRARVRKRLGDLERAIADYSKALKLAPTAQTYLARSLVWLEMGQLKGAIADSKQVVALQPDLAGGHRVLGKALGLAGDGLGAIAAYKKAARCYLNVADKENAQKCIAAIEPLKALSPIKTLSIKTLPIKTVTVGNETSAQIATGDANQTVTPADYIKRVQVRYEAGNYAAAKQDLDWLLSVQPHNAKALCLRGLAQAKLGHRAQAVTDLALAAQQHPAESEAGREVRLCRGQMRLILNDGYGAIEEFSALIETGSAQTPPEARWFAERGHSYRLLDDPDRAFKDYSNAIALDAENALLYELRAEMQTAIGAVEGATEDYQKAATLWLNRGNWQKHQQVVEAVRRLREQTVRKTTAVNASIPIKSFQNQLPVVEVLLDGIAKFDVVIDRNAPNSIITQQMANQLNLNLVSYRYVYLADGTPMELSIARLRSVVVGETIVTDVYVAIAPDSATVVLGKDCFSAYSIRISGSEITFLRR